MKKYPHQPLTYASYDPAWATLYLEEKRKIEAKLGDHLIHIEHIGSTAVPGLSGKPIIDILLIIDSESSADSCLKLLEGLDYQYIDKPDQYYLRRSTGEATGFHLHMTTPDNKLRRERIAFRDYLIHHPDVREDYAKLKQVLIRKSNDDRRAYREGKADFMEEITRKALEEYGRS